MAPSTRAPAWFLLITALVGLFALARALGFVLHRPLLAYANNYDQIRYTTCLDLAPWRPGVRADTGNPQAPLQRYAFQPLPKGSCIWTSDLLFSAPVDAVWRLSEALGARAVHSVRRLGELRLLCWLVLAGWATFALQRAGQPELAAAYLAWLALFGLDPANLLYFSTFYAEAAAVTGFHAAGIGVVVALVRPSRSALTVAAFGAVLLAASKFQHVVLPLLLGLALLFGAGRDGRRAALAVMLGATLGLAAQLAGTVRDGPAARSISAVNRANFTLLVLLPESSDRARVGAILDLEESCLAYTGRSVYAMPVPVDRVCSGVDRWSRATLWWLLISDPPALGRALMHIPKLLLPWATGGLGQVEGKVWASLPATQPSWNAVFGDHRAVATGLLLLPWLVFVACFARRAPRIARGFALMCAVGSSSVVLVALFGDGDVDFAKHSHLALNYSLASLGLPLAAMARCLLQQSQSR
jgi:hypothetical protein